MVGRKRRELKRIDPHRAQRDTDGMKEIEEFDPQMVRIDADGRGGKKLSLKSSTRRYSIFKKSIYMIFQSNFILIYMSQS
jgi:hypothetical protein